MEYDPATEFFQNGVVKKCHKGSREELLNDDKFKHVFNKLGIKPSEKGEDLDDILLEFI